MKTKTLVYSTDELFKKIDNMTLSKREAEQLKRSIELLQNTPIDLIHENKKIRKQSGAKNLYSCRVTRNKRLMFSTMKDDAPKIILHDLIDISSPYIINRSDKTQK